MAKFVENTATVKKAVQKKKKDEETVQKKQSPSVSQRQNQKTYGNKEGQTVKKNTKTKQTTTSSQNRTEQSRRTLGTSAQKASKAMSNVRTSEKVKQDAKSKNERKDFGTSVTSRTIQDNFSKYKQDKQKQEVANDRRWTKSQDTVKGIKTLNENKSRITEAVKNTPGAIRHGVESGIGYATTAADVMQMDLEVEPKKWESAVLRVDPNKRKQGYTLSKLSNEQNVGHKLYEKTKKIQEASDKRYQEMQKDATAPERWWYGALDSSVGVAEDAAVSAAIPGLSPLGAMFLRVYGNTRGQAQKEGATETEDRANAVTQAVIENITERTFGGFGAARAYTRGGKEFIPMARMVEDKLFKKLAGKRGGQALSVLARLAISGTEEGLEEVEANLLSPGTQNLVYANRLQKEKDDEARQAWRSIGDTYTQGIANEQDAIARMDEVNSAEFKSKQINQYMQNGASREEAEQQTSKLVDYLNARLLNDTDTAEAIENTIKSSEYVRKKFDLNDTIDAYMSAFLSVALTGTASSIKSTKAGQAYMDKYGDEGVNALVENAIKYDPENSARAKAMKDHLDNGGKLTATQVADLLGSNSRVLPDAWGRQNTRDKLVAKKRKKENLLADPVRYDEDGNYELAPATEELYAKYAGNAMENLKSSFEEADEETTREVANIVAAFQAGVVTANQLDKLTVDNPEARAMFKAATGIDLDNFNIKTKKGDVNTAKSNINMQEKLFALASENLVVSARAEQANWNDTERGAIAKEISKGVGPKGDTAVHDAMMAVDPRDADSFYLMSQVAKNMYSRAWYTEDSWDSVKELYRKQHPDIDINILRDVYDAAKADRAEAETPFINAKVKVGEAMNKIDSNKAEAVPRGKFTNLTPYDPETKTGRDLKESERIVGVSLAQAFNANIYMVDPKHEKLVVKRDGEAKGYANAAADLKTGEIYISNAVGFEKAVHEFTHMGARLASEEYKDMAHYILDKAYKHAPEKTKALVDAYKEAYAGQDLTDAQIEEEVVSDIVSAFNNDPVFVREIAQENPSLAKKIYNAICDVLRALRNVLATGKIQDPAVQESFLVEIGAYEETRQLWLKMMRAAERNNAAMGIAEWERNAYKDSRMSQNTEEVRNSLADIPYMRAVNKGDMETAQKLVDEAAKKAGYKVAHAYHGTTNYGFTEFLKSKAQVDGNSGAGFYFTTNKSDSDTNYSNVEGADVALKIDRLADKIYDERTWNGVKVTSMGQARELAKEEMDKNQGVYDVYLDYKTPYIRDRRDSTDILDTINERGEDVYDAVDDAVTKALADIKSNYNIIDMPYKRSIINRIVNYANKNRMLTWYWIEKAINDEGEVNLDREEWGDSGQGATELTRAIVEAFGFDAVLDKEVDSKFGSLSENMEKGTEHIIVFKPEQIKDSSPVTYDDSGKVIPISQRFNTENRDIRYSITPEQQEKLDLDVGPDVRFSAPTYREELPKAVFNSSEGYSAYDGKKSGRQITYDLTKNNFSEEQAKAVTDYMDMMATWFEKTGAGSLRAEYKFIGWDDLTKAKVQVKKDSEGNIIGVTVSAMVKNGEYPVNFDLTTVCNKREGFSEVIKNLINTKVPGTESNVLNTIKLTDENMWKINKALKAEGIDTACLGCFVEARRYYAQNFMNKIDDKWNSAVRKARAELGLPEEEYFDFAKGKEVSGEEWSAIDDLWSAYDESTESKSSPADRIKILMDEIVKNKETDSPYLKLIQMSDISTPEGYNAFKQLSTKGHDMVKTIKSIYGTSAPKEILAFTPYNSEIALLPENMKGMDTADYLKSIGGIRVQSFSDFKIEHVFEHFQMVADEAARKFVTHGYSKVIAFPRIFGLTGRKINMSVMFDVLPNKAWSQALGIPVRKAAKYAKKYQGLQFVKEKPAENLDNRPYIETEIEGVHGYLTYLVSDADYVNSIYEKEYAKNIEAGMSENEARRAANEAKPFEQSINYREAVELENRDGYKENVGIIAVAYGDEHLKVLLSDPNVRYIIPYHKSGLPTFISKKTSLAIARDYTNFQNTNKVDTWKDAKGNDVDYKKEYAKYKREHKDDKYPAIGFFKEINDNKHKIKFASKTAAEKATMAGTADFDVYKDLGNAKDIREIPNAYLEHCIKNDWCPVFHEFAGDPNYYKVLFDFAVTDGTTTNIYPQREVRNNYPGLDIDAKVAAGEEITEADLAELKKAVEKGAEEQNAKNMTRSNNMGNVMNDLLSRDTENSIISDTNLQSIRWGTPDYTDVKLGNEEMTPEETSDDIKLSISVNFDEAYMDAVNSGNMEEAQRLVDEAAKKAMPNTKLHGLWYHGTDDDFNIFDFRQGGKNGTAEGFGIYLSDSQEVTQHYGDRQIKGYVNMERPASAFEQTLTQSELIKLITATVDYEAQKMADEYDGDIEAAKKDTWISNYVNTSQTTLNNAIRETAKAVVKWNGNDMDIVQEIMNGMGIREYDEAVVFNDILTDTTGIDGYMTKWGDEDDMNNPDNPTIAVAFRSNQIKSADTVTYAEDGSIIPLSERFDPNNDDIRYSMPTTDADGNVLTNGQMEYFKNSQARDEQGRLVPVYHTTNIGGFTVFDPSYSEDGRSIFFTDSEAVSKTYGAKDLRTTYECYLNLENPLIVDADYNAWDRIPMTRKLGNISLTEDYDTNEVSRIAFEEGHDGVIINNCRDWAVDDSSEFDTSENSPYSTIYIAFSSNQVKDTRNENPSENPDIRFSIPTEQETMAYAANNATSTDELWASDPIVAEGRVRYSMSKDDFINGKIKKWNPAWRTNGEVLNAKSVEPNIRSVIMDAMKYSDTDAKYRQAMVEDTVAVAMQAYKDMRNYKPMDAAMKLYDQAHAIIENLEFFEDAGKEDFERWKALRDYLLRTQFTVPEEDQSDIDYDEYMEQTFGQVLLKSKGTYPTDAWETLSQMWPEMFTEDIKDDNASILLRIQDALNVCKPLTVAYNSEECESLASEIAGSLYDIIEQGKEYKSLADKYDDKVKAMKARHREAITQVEAKAKERVARERERGNKRVEKEKEKGQARLERSNERWRRWAGRTLDKEKRKAEYKREKLNEAWKGKTAKATRKRKDSEAHRKLYNRVLKEYKDLTDRLLKPSKDRTKNIPEPLRQPLAEMLACFDLEKDRSKKLEEKYMIPTRSQLNFRMLRDALKQVTQEEPTAYEIGDLHKYFEDKMTDIANRVDGKTIDYLSNEDIETVKELLKGLNGAIKNYVQLEIDGESYQAQVKCDEVMEGATEHTKLYGPVRKREGLIGWLDNIVNMGELTPWYFFRQMPGMSDMYRQLRKGFDEYVRNEDEIINKISEILAETYKTDRKGNRTPGSDIEQWRSSESAETFNLTYGPISLTIAQRMSLYCLAKREAAKGHMYSDNGGVVASETSAGSKIGKAKEMTAGKIVQQDRLVLTPADIDTIKVSLTPQQISIADKLQKLMSEDMSELGNKASMKLLFIEMYKEKDYFPIKVQGDSRATNLDKIGIREKVRNPGFSNPLVDNAQNPIILDDIFSVVASHCNEMNLYASYAVPITSFMKVYNGKALNEHGKAVPIKQIIRNTYGDKAIQYIENFIDDINGNSFKRNGGLDDVLDKAIGQAKKAAVFANLRVAVQQPTAIVRAFAVMKPKHFVGVHPSAKATQEMFEYCPIAKWKAWGYYDTHFGRDIEDVMMGRDVSSKADKYMSEIYGQLDNMTWGMIWQAVKNEVHEQNPDMDIASEEFLKLCGDRASEVFDSTQVVDSPFHRSNDMRSKNGLVKQMTSFQAEPTLSFNVLRQGFVDAYEAYKKGDHAKARHMVERVVLVWTAQALTVSFAQSVVDALRRKGHTGDDDDEDQALKWYQEWFKYFMRNFPKNFEDALNPINNVYWVKDFLPGIINALRGEYVYGQSNLVYQWYDTLTKGIQYCKNKWEKGDAYSKSWYDCLTELFGGLGYMTGTPNKTIMRGTKNAFHWFNKITGMDVFADDGSVDEAVEKIVSKLRKSDSGTGTSAAGSGSDSEGGFFSRLFSGKDTEAAEENAEYTEEKLPEGLTEEQIEEVRKAEDRRNKKKAKSTDENGEVQDVKDRDYKTMLFDATKASVGYEGEERNKKIWESVSKGYKDHIQDGDFAYIARMRRVVEESGGDLAYFDEQVLKSSKSAMKKTIEPGGADTESEMVAQQNIKYYLLSHGMSEEEISSEIAYKSKAVRDLKVAYMINDQQAIIGSTYTLMWAGITEADLERVYKNRNKIDLTKYKVDGKYKDKLKSTGTFVWPTIGTITSHFGGRSAPTRGASSYHQAIDIGASQGTPVVAADGGVIITAGANGGYGNSVGIKHDNGMITYYNHLYAWNVKVGDTVAQGQQIGQVGSTGISTGPHLDFKIMVNGKAVDPEQYLPAS